MWLASWVLPGATKQGPEKWIHVEGSQRQRWGLVGDMYTVGFLEVWTCDQTAQNGGWCSDKMPVSYLLYLRNDKSSSPISVGFSMVPFQVNVGFWTEEDLGEKVSTPKHSWAKAFGLLSCTTRGQRGQSKLTQSKLSVRSCQHSNDLQILTPSCLGLDIFYLASDVNSMNTE